MSTKTPRFGFDILASLNGAQPRFLTTPMEGPAFNRAEAHLLELFSQEYCDSRPRGVDEQGNPLPLPIVSQDRLASFVAECTAQEKEMIGHSLNKNDISKIDTGARKVLVLWFVDGSCIMLEELANGGYACLPFSIFLSGDVEENWHRDIDAWCEAMRRMPQVLPHCDQDVIDRLTEDQVIAPWGNFRCRVPYDNISSFLQPYIQYAILLRAQELGPARYTFTLYHRAIQRDGSIGPSLIRISTRSSHVQPAKQTWFPRELQGIMDHPKYPIPAWRQVEQKAGEEFAEGHSIFNVAYSASISITEAPTAHEAIEARAELALLHERETA